MGRRVTTGFFLLCCCCCLSYGQTDPLRELWKSEIGKNVRKFTIEPGQASSASFRLGPGVDLVYVAPPEVEVRLIDPLGAVITRENAPQRFIQWSGGPGGFTLPASMQIAGGATWWIEEVATPGVYRIEARVSPAGNRRRVWAVSTLEPLKAARAVSLDAALEVSPAALRANDPVSLRMCTNNRLLMGRAGWFRVPGLLEQRQSFTYRGGGCYTAVFVPRQGGSYGLEAWVEGAADQAHGGLDVQPDPARIVNASSRLVDKNRDGVVERLEVPVTLQVNTGGEFSVDVILQKGGRTAHAFVRLALVPGLHTAVVSFGAREVDALEVDGPYQIAKVSVSDNREHDVRTNIGWTPRLLAGNMERSGLRILPRVSLTGIDTDGNGLFNVLRLQAQVSGPGGGRCQWEGTLNGEENRPAGRASANGVLRRGLDNAKLDFDAGWARRLGTAKGMEVKLSVHCGDRHDFKALPVVLPPLETLERTQPDLRIASPTVLTLPAGGRVDVAMLLTPLSGFSGTVQRVISGLPPAVAPPGDRGAQYAFQETEGVRHTILSLAAAKDATPGRFPLRISFRQNEWHREVDLELVVTPALPPPPLPLPEIPAAQRYQPFRDALSRQTAAVRVMLLVDRSGSLHASGTCSDLLEDALEFGRQFRAGKDEVGVATFANRGSVAFPPSPSFADRLAQVVAPCVGWSNHLEAFDAAVTALGQQGPRAILIITDGEPNVLPIEWACQPGSPRQRVSMIGQLTDVTGKALACLPEFLPETDAHGHSLTGRSPIGRLNGHIRPESLKLAAANALDHRIAAARAAGIRTYVAGLDERIPGTDLSFPHGAFLALTIDDLPTAIRRAAEAMVREFNNTTTNHFPF